MASYGLTKRALVLAKTEATEGTDASPAAATDALLVSNIAVNDTGEEIERDIITENFSPLGFVVGVFYGGCSFTTELRSIRTAITEANRLRVEPLYNACNMSAQYAASSVVYQPLSDWASVVNSATLYFYLDGLLHILVGARGEMKMDATVGKYGALNWTFSGVMLQINSPAGGTDGVRDATIASAGTPSHQAFSVKPPPILGVSLSMHGFTTAKVNQVTFELQNDIQRRDDMSADNGIASFILNGRKPQGTMNPEQVTRATHDFWGRWKAGTEGAIQFTVGKSAIAWDRVRFTIPAAQYKLPKLADRNGVRVNDMGYSANRVSAGDDECSIAYLL